MCQLIEIKVLGPFLARRSGGESFTFTNRKGQALLAYLGVGRQIATREEIAGLLWGDLSDERARHNLRQTLGKIRSMFGAVIASEGEILSLDTSLCAMDAIEFQHLASSEERSSLAQATMVYQGDLLDGYLPQDAELQDWLLGARSQLRQSYCDLLDRYTDSLIENQQHGAAIEALGRRLSMDPACELAHRKLMELLWRDGKRTDALRQYQTCVQAMQKELGVGPSIETSKLFDEISGAQAILESRGEIDHLNESNESDLPVIAVLPFTNLAKEDEQYFVDGITEDIITALSKFHSLLVIARSSVFVYKEQTATDPEVAFNPLIVLSGATFATDFLSVVMSDSGRPVKTTWMNCHEISLPDNHHLVC